MNWFTTDGGTQTSRYINDSFSIASDVGVKRSENQDRIALLHVGSASRMTGFWCLALCDGMGGMENGGRAASIALSAFFEELVRSRRLEPKKRLSEAAWAANRAVSNIVSGGGSTLSALIIERGKVYTVNVGDSRIFARTKTEDSLVRLTVDDTMEEAYKSSGKGLLQHIGMGDGLVPHIENINSSDYQSFVITSDGAHLIGEHMLSVLELNAASSSEYCHRVLQVARWMGGPDNASIGTFKVPENSPAETENISTDFSVWSLAGRLRIAWSERQTYGNRLPEVEKEKPQPSEAAEPVSEEDGARRAAKGERKSNPKKRSGSARGKSDEQIELGFSDEDED